MLERARDPDRAAVGRRGRARFPSLGVDDLAWVLHEPEAGVVRAQRAVEALAAQAAARGARVVRAPRHGRTATPRCSTTAPCSRATGSCGAAAAGSPACSANSSSSRSPGRSCSSSTAARRGRRARLGRLRPRDVRHRRRRRARRQGRADAEGPPLDPDADLPPASAETERLTRGYAADRFPALARGAAEGGEDLPLRALARLALHRRPAPGAPLGVDRRRRLRATASSTARRWPSGSTPLGRRRAAPAHFGLGSAARHVTAERRLEQTRRTTARRGGPRRRRAPRPAIRA